MKYILIALILAISLCYNAYATYCLNNRFVGELSIDYDSFVLDGNLINDYGNNHIKIIGKKHNIGRKCDCFMYGGKVYTVKIEGKY